MTVRGLYSALAERGLKRINTPAQYRHCHYLPESYQIIKGHTPETAFLPYDDSFSVGRALEAVGHFGDRPVVMKDYVKSRKHEWEEACFIPSAADRAAAERVVRRFLELQEGDGRAGSSSASTSSSSRWRGIRRVECR